MIDPRSVGAATPRRRFSWTDRETLLYALGVGADSSTLAYVTENSQGQEQRVLPTFGVVVADASTALGLVRGVDMGTIVHGAQSLRVHSPLPAAGAADVESRVDGVADKGEGENAIITLSARAYDPGTGRLLVETGSTVVARRSGGFGGPAPVRPEPVLLPDRAPDASITQVTSPSQALLYRLSGDRNPLHSDPWFAREKAGFESPILHGLCTYGYAGRVLLSVLCDDDDAAFTSMSARFTAPVIPGESLTTHVWVTDSGRAVFRTMAGSAGGEATRTVLDGGVAEYGAP